MLWCDLIILREFPVQAAHFDLIPSILIANHSLLGYNSSKLRTVHYLAVHYVDAGAGRVYWPADVLCYLLADNHC